MKIDEINQKSAVSHLGNGRAERPEPPDVHGEPVAKQHVAADKVELSSYMPVVLASQGRQDTRVNRIEEIKSQIESGSYQISGRSVAEKMLSKIVMSTTH